MSFEQKDWKDRIAEYINRRRITHEDGTSELITVERDEGTISQEGDAFNAENMNEFEERIAKALTPLDTMEEINANTQDNQLAGANAVKELGANVSKIDGSQSLSTSILEKALTLDKGVYEFTLSGGGYSSDDLPDMAYRYCNATIYVRNKGSIAAILHGMTDGGTGTHPMAMNYYDGTVWSGWNIGATKADLSNYLPLSGGTLSGDITLSNAKPFNSINIENGSRKLSLHLSSTDKMGLWDGAKDEWLIYSDTDGSVHIPHTIYVGDKQVALCDLPAITMTVNGFEAKYGKDSIPSDWGMVTMQGYSRPGTYSGDTYYHVVNHEGKSFNGRQINNATTIAWNRNLTTDDFVVTGSTNEATLTINLD